MHQRKLVKPDLMCHEEEAFYKTTSSSSNETIRQPVFEKIVAYSQISFINYIFRW